VQDGRNAVNQMIKAFHQMTEAMTLISEKIGAALDQPKGTAVQSAQFAEEIAG